MEAEEVERGVDVGDVDHDARDEVPVAVGVPVGAEGSFIFDATGDEIVGKFVELAAGDVFEFVNVYGTGTMKFNRDGTVQIPNGFITEISAALLRASARGVSVKALVPIQYEDEPPAQALVAAHLPVRLAKVHSKLLIVDRQLVITGSPNWSENSWANNEASVWIRDPMIAGAYAARFDAAFAAGADPPP